ncbi:MAG: YbjP/YqhG family protein [Bacteroidaceae bacterium]|nr:YbjP/YqhG family protein [Bacteroidaceae bacterium]
MKKMILPIMLLFVISVSACGRKEGGNALGTDADSVASSAVKTASNQNKEAARSVVEAAYKSYFNPSEEELREAEDAEINIFEISYMYKYLSKDFVEKLVMAYDKQNATDDLYFDYDIWINAQDDGDLTLKKVDIISYSNEKATAEVNFTNFGEENKAYVVVEYDKEKDAWLICDFLAPDDMSSFAEYVDDVLSDSYEEE